MPKSQNPPTTIVVRGGRSPISAGGGVTLGYVPLEWLKKHGNRKPLFRPKPRKKRK